METEPTTYSKDKHLTIPDMKFSRNIYCESDWDFGANRDEITIHYGKQSFTFFTADVTYVINELKEISKRINL